VRREYVWMGIWISKCEEDTMRFGGAYGCDSMGSLEEKRLLEARHEVSRQADAEIWAAAMRIERREQKWSMEAMIPSK